MTSSSSQVPFVAPRHSESYDIGSLNPAAKQLHDFAMTMPHPHNLAGLLGMEFDDVRDADAGKIKKAYNKAMIKIHPDKWQSQSAMPQGLKDRLREFYDRLQYAYTVLRDDERRRAYVVGGIAEVHIVEAERKEEGNTIDQPVLRAPRHKALNPAEIPQTLRQRCLSM